MLIFLGGSAMFGMGSTGDEKTIPSCVSRYLNNNKNTKFYYKCYNYGEFRASVTLKQVGLVRNCYLELFL